MSESQSVIYLPHEKDPEPPSPAASALVAVADPIEEPIAPREIAATRVDPIRRPILAGPTERTVFALGGAAGVGVALLMTAILWPFLHVAPTGAVPSRPVFAAPVANNDVQPMIVLDPPAIGVSVSGDPLVVANVDQVLPDLTVVAPPPVSVKHPASAVAVARPRPVHSPEPAASAVAAATAPSEASPAPTVLYRATPAAVVPPAEAPSPAAPPVATAAAHSVTLSVVAIPSADLALIAQRVNGQMLVSPYKVGQALPDGRIITALDPGTRTVSTNRGTISGS